MRVFFIYIFFFFFTGLIFSQKVGDLPKEEQQYLKKVAKLFQNSSNKKKGKEISDKLTDEWLKNNFNDKWKLEIIETTERLEERRAIAFPHFDDYFNTLIAFANNNDRFEYYEEWYKILDRIIEDKSINFKYLTRFLNLSRRIAENNVIYENASVTWKVKNGKQKLKYHKDDIALFICENIDLVCYSRNDSSIIYNTSGIYYPLDKDYKWIGVNGKVLWQRAALPADRVYARLKKYTLDVSKNNYTADSVSFVHKEYFNKPLMGILEEKLLANVTPEKARYPKFKSYENRFELPGIYKSVDYEGGFSIEGAEIIGSGNNKKKAYLYFYKEDTLFLTASGNKFTFKKEQIIGANTTITFKLDTDSIYHPGLLFKFLIQKRRVELLRDGRGISRIPFLNSFHRVYMDVQTIGWDIDNPVMDLGMMRSSSGISNASFESLDYYTIDRYYKIKMFDKVHPLVAIKDFSLEFMNDEFPVLDFAAYMGVSKAQVTQMLLRLAYMGFISIDTDNNMIKINKRTYNYINARSGRLDYDVLLFNSTTYNNNSIAKMNLLNYDLKMEGVPFVQLSDSQNVVVFPQNEKLVLKRNRFFKFDGRVQAGLFTFYGKEFEMDYENFKINLNNVDSLKIKVKTGNQDAYGRYQYAMVRSTIENIRGDLLIDAPHNKSGYKSMGQYPIFNSIKDSYVFYDRKNIQSGVYSRDKFYFKIFPYQIDSLDNFTKKSLAFDGHFSSQGIFPSFDETLILMPDYSLGFIRKTPPEGYPVYGGKGKFINDISLSNAGLRGSGRFDYVTSVTMSDDYLFFPDSMNTNANTFDIERQKGPPEFPHVEGKDVYVHWMPYLDELYTKKRETPITMYEKQAYMHGTLKLQPTGLTGWGKMDIESSNLLSNEFVYSENIIDADTANFNLKSLDLGDLAFKTDNVNAHVDFNERVGYFKSNGEASFVEFPKNQYICYMDQVNWYMDNAELEMSLNADKSKEVENWDELSPTEQEDVQLEGPRFISVHPRQDSLAFVSPSAKYSLLRHTITAKDVKFIRVADATVYPDIEEPVIIEKKAVMRPLKNAEIVANITTRYHRIYNSNVKIFGKKEYRADGDYDYIDETERKLPIHFEEVGVDSTLQTYAKGKIIEPDNFSLSPNYLYQGDVDLLASKEFLNFDGAVKIQHECDTIGRSWVQFTADIDPLNIYIPIDSFPKSINGYPLATGMVMTRKADNAKVYPSFLSIMTEKGDDPVLRPSGFLFYDHEDAKYKIARKDKLEEINLPGQYFHIHRSICNSYGEGVMNFQADLGQVSLIPVGNVTANLDGSDIEFNVVISLDFYFAQGSIKRMAEMIQGDESLSGVDLSSKTYSKAMTELVGAEVADKWLSQVSLGSLKKYPKELENRILLTDVKLEWNPQTTSYRSIGNIGIGNIYKEQVNKYVKGAIEIVRKRSGDLLYIYLEIDPGNWFFFKYRAGQMLGVSSDKEFNETITEMKKDKLKLDIKKGETPYRYYISNETQKKKFLKRFMEGGMEEDVEEDDSKRKKRNKND